MTTRPEPRGEDWEKAVRLAKAEMARLRDEAVNGHDCARAVGYNDALCDIIGEAHRIAGEREGNG